MSMPRSRVQVVEQKRMRRRGGYTEFLQVSVGIPSAVVDQLGGIRKGELFLWEVVDEGVILIHRKDIVDAEEKQGQILARKEEMEKMRQQLLAEGWRPQAMPQKEPGDRVKTRKIPMDSGGGGWEDKD